MSEYDVTPDDEPLDLAAVGADDAAIEGLRRALSPEAAVVWDDDEDDLDPAFALLRALQRDVDADLPGATEVAHGVTPLIGRTRRLGRGATVAALVAGVVSIGGVAAASAPGQPLAGLRHAVSSALGHAVEAVTPSAPVGPRAAVPKHSAKPTAKPTAEPTAKADGEATSPGSTTSDASRSEAAAAQVADELVRAARLLDRGQTTAARNLLEVAAHKLPLVSDSATHDRLSARLAALRARLAESPSAKNRSADEHQGHQSDGTDAGKGKSSEQRGDSGRATSSEQPGDSGKGKPTEQPGDSGKGKPTEQPGDGGHGKPTRGPGTGSASHTAGGGSDRLAPTRPAPKLEAPPSDVAASES